MDSIEYMAWRHRLAGHTQSLKNIIRTPQHGMIWLTVQFHDERHDVHIPTETPFDISKPVFEQPVTDPLALAKVEALA
jgi:hypothetical protein